MEDMAGVQDNIQEQAPVAEPSDGAKPIEPVKESINPYAEKGWYKKVLDDEGNISQDKILKQLDNLDSLIGKKDLLPDFENAEETEKFLAKTRPESKDVYEFGEKTSPIIKEAMSDIFHKNGVTAYQANNIIKAFNEIEESVYAESNSIEGYKESMKQSFGEGWEAKAKSVQDTVIAHAGEDVKSELEKVPNQHLGAMYKAIDSIIKAYGANETGAQANANANGGVNVDKTEQRAAIRQKLADLRTRPHTHEEAQNLIKQLHATY